MKSPYIQTTEQPLRKDRPGLMGNERGMALILAIGLLAIMSILASTLMSLSTSEIKLSSNYRDDQEAFFAAERAIEYSVTGAAINAGDVDLYADTLHRDRINIAGAKSSMDPSGDNNVRFVGAGTPPIGSGSDASKFHALNYVISATGIYPNTATNPSRAVIRAHVAKVVPK